MYMVDPTLPRKYNSLWVEVLYPQIRWPKLVRSRKTLTDSLCDLQLSCYQVIKEDDRRPSLFSYQNRNISIGAPDDL